jgi:capsular exopolysaccharide synthesis family protein
MALPSTEREAPAPDGGDSLDLRHVLGVLLRRRWAVAAVLAVAVGGTLVYALRQQKVYGAVCTIIIDSQAPRVLDAEQVQDVVESGAASAWDRNYFETQYRILTSRVVASRVAERLALGSSARFLGIDRVQDPAERERLRAAADPVALVQQRLTVEPVKDSRVVRLVVEDGDPELAAAIANAFAEAYVSESLAVRSSTTRNASEWLAGQLADLEGKLEESGKALFEFKRRNDIVSTSWEDRQTMVSQRLTATNEALAKVRVQRAQLRARADAIQEVLGGPKGGDAGLDSLPAVASNDSIQSLKKQFLDARTECADLRVKYLEDHPKLHACDEKLAITRANLQQEIKTTLSSALREYDEVVRTERNLKALYDETKAEAFGFNQYEREYLELKRTYENNQRLYDTVLKRLKDAGLAGLLETSNVRILDRARPSVAPVRPNLPRNLLAALVLGLIAGIGLAFAIEALDNTVRTHEHVERIGITFLGAIPRAAPGPDGAADPLVVQRSPKSSTAEFCRAIRTNLLFMSPDRPLATLLVTSSGPEEGKTTTAIDLAIAMAESGGRVLLLDADMRRPRIHRALGLPNAAGLSSLIVGDARLEDTVRETPVANLSAVTCGPIPPNPAELLHTEAFAALLARLRGQFDRVVIDSPPVAAVSDALVLSTQVDGTVLVLRAGATTREAARGAVRALSDVNARILGAVLNDVDLSGSRYGGYYHASGYEYGEKREEAA